MRPSGAAFHCEITEQKKTDTQTKLQLPRGSALESSRASSGGRSAGTLATTCALSWWLLAIAGIQDSRETSASAACLACDAAGAQNLFDEMGREKSGSLLIKYRDAMLSLYLHFSLFLFSWFQWHTRIAMPWPGRQAMKSQRILVHLKSGVCCG